MRAVLPLCRQHGVTLITNMGVANPPAAAERTVAVARELSIDGLRVAAVTGDDVTDRIGPDAQLIEPGCSLAETGRQMLAANAYLGSDAILALESLTPKQWGVKKDGGQFDQFSGATITPRAVVQAVHAGLEFYKANQVALLSPPVIREQIIRVEQATEEKP